ncbi:uncharacterized protein LOC104898750 [Beta vulgaris subsp. vulgaris]|uniref:uncharacterized protein LOC104898750 n=1 Tax=Beta vulgaris subsp. vulgaris TaxID=3555 RepID=UPI00053F7657|nr:uncharacterized protein LOC104898750 [Beta vulgaris subsp. vulgaris]
MASLKEITTNFQKLDKFEGIGYRRWQKKIHFLLTTLNVVYVLSTPMPPLPEEGKTETPEETRARTKWENDDYICRGHILNAMSDTLFDIYQYVESAKELWGALEAKYVAEDASSKKFLVSNFNSYKMIDGRSVMEQFHEVQHMLNQIRQQGMVMDESFSVASIIDKLPPSWKDTRNSLKHKKETMSLVDLGAHLRIEEGIRSQDVSKDPKNGPVSSINMMEEGQSSWTKKSKKPPWKSNKNHPENDKKKGKTMSCGGCGGSHMKRNCPSLPKKNKDHLKVDPHQGPFAHDVSLNEERNFIAMISEINVVQDDDSW